MNPWPSLVVGLWALLAAAPASGQPELVRHIVFSAEHSCGTKQAFLTHLRQRLPNIREADSNEYAAFIRVSTNRVPEHAQGVLELVELDGSWSKRELVAADCDELLDGLSLIAALILSGGTIGRSTVSPVPQPATPSVSTEALARKPRRPPDEPRDAQPAGLASSGVVWAKGGVQAAETIGVFPSWSFGVAGFVHVAYRPGASWEPGVRLSAQRIGGSRYRLGTASADFSWTSAAASICPLYWAVAEAAHIGACAGVDAGWIEASGSAIDVPRSEKRGWLAAVGTLQGNWMVLQDWGLELEMAAFVPLRRDRYSFDDQVFHEVGPVVLRVAAGVVVQFH